MTPVTSPGTLAVGPGYSWLQYTDQGVDYAALYLDGGGLVRRDGRRWYHAGTTGQRQWIDPARLEPLRGTQPDDFPVWPEQGDLALPAELANNPDTGDLLQTIYDEHGLTGPDAWKMAGDVLSRIHYEQSTGLAKRITRDAQLAREADLDSLDAATVNDILSIDRPPRIPLFGALLAEGHNATIVARWKVGKSTYVDNAAIAAASGGMFLGRFECPNPVRVVLFNYELHEDDMAERLNGYAIPIGVADNIVVVNLRGRRLPITTTKGRDVAVRILNDNAAQLWILDPFGAAFAAAGGQDENNNAEVRRFLIALDEIKRLANCASMLMPVHTGRRTDADGDEQGRGATVLEDWPDVRMLLTRGKDDQRDQRFIRTEGRAWELDESRLTFNDLTKHLSLEGTDMGVSRRRARDLKSAQAVTDVVAEHPGLNKTQLRDLLGDNAGITNNGQKDAAVKEARQQKYIHVHENGQAHLHYQGGVHADSAPCPGGFTP